MRSLLRLFSVLCLAACSANGLAADAAPLGRYNFVLGKAGGGSEMGVGTFLVSAQGAARGIVRLSDGTALSGGGKLDANGVWEVEMSGRDGVSLAGKIAFSAAANRCSGTLVAEGLGGSGPQQIGLRAFGSNVSGVSQTLKLSGSRYAGAAKFPVIKQSGSMAVQVTSGPGKRILNAIPMRLTPAGAFLPVFSGPPPLTLRFDPKTGLVRGSRDDGTWVMHGVMLSQEKLMRGFIEYSGGWTFTVKAGRATAAAQGSSGSAGVMVVRTNASQYTGGVTVSSGGDLNYSAGGRTNGTVQVGDFGGVVTTGAGTNTVSGGTTVTGGTLTLSSGNTSSSGVVKTGVGSVTLSGNNAFTGGTTTTGGTLNLTGNLTGTTTLTGGTVTLGNTATGNTTLNLSGGTLSVTGANLVNNLGNASITTGGLAGHSITISRPADTSFASGFRVTNEAGETIALADVSDGQIIFLNGTRYRATRVVDGPLTLTFAPVLIAI